MQKKIKYSMPRGDSRTLPLAVPLSTYSVGASIFFALKKIIDDDADDSTGFALKKLTDADIVSTDATHKHYVLALGPSDTNLIPPDTYLAELEFVSADKSVVITFPDAAVAVWHFEITGDVNRRVT